MGVSRRSGFLAVFFVILGLAIAADWRIAVAAQENCPDLIRMLGNSQQGNKVQARIQGTWVPSYVQIDGTNDVEPVRGESSIWVSRDKYISLGLTLVLLDENMLPIEECSYDADGKLLPPPQCAEFLLLEVTAERTQELGNYARVHWFMSLEDGVTEYSVQHANSTSGPFIEIATVLPTGSGEYAFNDTNPLGGTSWYRVQANAPGCEVSSEAVSIEF